MPLKKRNISIPDTIKLKRKNPAKNQRSNSPVLDLMKMHNHEGWNYCDGGFHRFEEIHKNRLNHKPLNFLLDELKTHNPKVMILGPGKGYDTAIFKRELKDYGVNPKIDTLGYSKTIDKKLIEDKKIRKDFSPPISKALSFEHINPVEHSKLVKEIIGKYHLVMASRSVGVYNKSSSYAIFQTSLLLAKRGRAYIDLVYTKPLKQIITVTERMINSYNKTNNTNLRFKIKGLKDTAESDDQGNHIYIQIDRV